MRVLGIGNALTDYLFRLDSDELLEKLGLPKGSMQLVDREQAEMILKTIGSRAVQITAGGSAANTIHGLSGLGISSGFIGKIGKDETGEMFRKSLLESRINPILFTSNTGSGFAIALISPDGERTFATYLGAAVELSEDDLNPDDFERYDILHIEGYLVQNQNLVRRALEIARNLNMKISVDLASYNVVESNKEFLSQIISHYTDIVFANEEEAMALTGYAPESAAREIGGKTEFTVIKLGSQGSIIYHKGKIKKIGIYPATCIDTTGAGDLYASGFLFGVMNKMDVRSCGEIGALLAGHVVEELGAKISPEKWILLNDTLNLYQQKED